MFDRTRARLYIIAVSFVVLAIFATVLAPGALSPSTPPRPSSHLLVLAKAVKLFPQPVQDRVHLVGVAPKDQFGRDEHRQCTAYVDERGGRARRQHLFRTALATRVLEEEPVLAFGAQNTSSTFGACEGRLWGFRRCVCDARNFAVAQTPKYCCGAKVGVGVPREVGRRPKSIQRRENTIGARRPRARLGAHVALRCAGEAESTAWACSTFYRASRGRLPPIASHASAGRFRVFDFSIVTDLVRYPTSKHLRKCFIRTGSYFNPQVLFVAAWR